MIRLLMEFVSIYKCWLSTLFEDLLELQDDGALTARLTNGEGVEMEIYSSFDRRAPAATGCIYFPPAADQNNLHTNLVLNLYPGAAAAAEPLSTAAFKLDAKDRPHIINFKYWAGSPVSSISVSLPLSPFLVLV